MAYDQQNNYYFNPEIDSEDAALLDQTDKLGAAMNYKQQKMAAANSAQVMGEGWQEALKSANITQDEYNALCNQDPQRATNLIKGAMKAVAQTVASRKGKPAPQRTSESQAQSQPKTVVVQPDLKRFDDLKEKSNKTGLSEDEELEGVKIATAGISWE